MKRILSFFKNLTKKQIIIMCSVLAAAVIAVLLCVFMFVVWTINGIDISHYEGDISWVAMAQSGTVHFVYMKATEGSTNQDPTFKDNWDGAFKNGIPAGAYHYFTKTSAAADQAKNFIANVPKVTGMLPPAVDVEGSISAEPNFKSELAAYVKAITDYYGVKPVFYVPYSIYNVIYDDYTGYTFWIYDDQAQPLVNNWTFRQYSTKGKIAGVNGDVDLDQYQGTLWNFEQLKMK